MRTVRHHFCGYKTSQLFAVKFIYIPAIGIECSEMMIEDSDVLGGLYKMDIETTMFVLLSCLASPRFRHSASFFPSS